MIKKTVQGKLQGNGRGYAFLIPSDGTPNDFFVSHSDLKGAMHGDEVIAETVTSESGKRTTARVLKITSRGIGEIVGTYFTSQTHGYVVPDDKKYFCDITVPFGKGARANSGDKVVAKILSYPKRGNPEGIVTRVLGRQFDKAAELKSISATYELPERFPKSVSDYAEGLPDKIIAEDLQGRRDFSDELIFTIDGEDSRDYDDAVSIEKLGGGKYRLGVHIADVTHYVKENSPVDKEAFVRATSVYFPESVIPMLPERLCNDLCSLKEGVRRLTLSCVMTVDDKGKVIEKAIIPSVIKSKARMTYNQVEKILSGDKALNEKYNFLTESLKNMSDLADILISAREKRGSIDLDVKESAISVDGSGEITIESAKRDKAHRIIEEFMILANVTVAEYMTDNSSPFIYRVHEKPSAEKTEIFYSFLNGLGVKHGFGNENVCPKDFSEILKNAENTPAFTVINRVMLRSMQKAKYSPENSGHFGLSEERYCHFTSPIRRYPDLVVHRLVKEKLKGKEGNVKRYKEFVAEAAKQSSEMERRAIEAERAVDDYYKALYISGHTGESFIATVSGVTGFGIFAELKNGVEGLIKTETLNGKRFVYDEKNFSLSDGKTTYKLGQELKIIVAGVNLAERRAEFLIDEPCKLIMQKANKGDRKKRKGKPHGRKNHLH